MQIFNTTNIYIYIYVYVYIYYTTTDVQFQYSFLSIKETKVVNSRKKLIITYFIIGNLWRVIWQQKLKPCESNKLNKERKTKRHLIVWKYFCKNKETSAKKYL